MVDLPESWAAIALSDAVINITITDKKIPQKEYLSEGAYPVFDQGQDYIGGYSDKKEKLVDCVLPVIVFGDHTRVIKFVNRPFAAGADGIKVLQPQHFYNPRLLEYFTRHIATHLTNHGYARHYQHLVKSIIPLPPVNEQRRIVAKIEELFSELDKGIENLKTAREQLKVYRQALLKHAFEGKLTAPWRAANPDKLEPAATLLARIQSEREQRYRQQLQQWQATGGSLVQRAGKPKAPKPLPPLTAEELAELPELPELPEGWGHIQIGSLLDVVSGNTPKGIENTTGIEIPYYRVSDMNRGGNEVSMNTSATYLSEKEAAKIGLNIFLAGTIIFPKRGGAIATNKKRRLARRSCFDLNLMGLTNLPDSLSANYLWLWVLSLDLASISDGSNVPQINNRNVEPLAFPICSFEEQARIVELAEARLSEADQLELTLAASLQQAEALRQSILKRAFSGQLVAQDANDEPATALLARIRAERAVGAKNALTAAKPRKAAGKKA